jgi:ATP-dependent Zn protease
MITDMVAKYGMDEDIGPILYRDIEKEDYGFMKPYSEQTAELIDEKIKEYLISSYKKSKKLLLERKKEIDKMAAVLLYREYITKDEFEKLMEDISYADTLLEQTKKHEKEITKKKK